MRGKKRTRRAVKVSEEFLKDKGIDFVHSMVIRYNNGWVGIRKTIRSGIAGDDFCQNMFTVVVDVMRVPHILAPKTHRKNKMSNRKLKRLLNEKV